MGVFKIIKLIVTVVIIVGIIYVARTCGKVF